VLLRLAAHLIVAVLLTARWQHNRCRAQFSASDNLPQAFPSIPRSQRPFD